MNIQTITRIILDESAPEDFNSINKIEIQTNDSFKPIYAYIKNSNELHWYSKDYIQYSPSCRGMYRAFTNLVEIPTNVGPDNIVYMDQMFAFCYNFNQEVYIPDSAENCSYMFDTCMKFNQPVNVGNNVTNCSYMFMNCYNFNGSVTIGNNVTNCAEMFMNCRNFNQPVTIYGSSNITNCYGMFWSCTKFNQYVVIGNNVESCSKMFQDCHAFSYVVRIPDSVRYWSNMFKNCPAHGVFSNGAILWNNGNITGP